MVGMDKISYSENFVTKLLLANRRKHPYVMGYWGEFVGHTPTFLQLALKGEEVWSLNPCKLTQMKTHKSKNKFIMEAKLQEVCTHVSHK
jgi:hypothetical protein